MLVNSQEAAICKRRLKKEFEGLESNPVPNIKIKLKGIIDEYSEDVHLNWYCLLHDLSDPFSDGEYIFHIKLSGRYPFEPPDFLFLTPNGRFTLNTKLCFSNSSHHKETWSPIWTMRTILLGFLSFFLDNDSNGIGHIHTR